MASAKEHYIIHSSNQKYSCKITTYSFPGHPVSKTVSFGGKRTYCVIGAWKSDKPDTIYIDRIEYDKGCIIDGFLEHGKGTTHMIQCAFYTIHKLIPAIKNISFTDDSHIYCQEGSKKYKLSLAHDYILKYNETWYENKFKATLPEPLLISLKESLEVLDRPLPPLEFQIVISPYLEKYKEIYESVGSAREFFIKLREKYGASYCFEVWFWIRDFLEQSLHIKLFKDMWYIRTDDLIEPEEFSIEKDIEENQKGGYRRTRRKGRIYQEEYSRAGALGLYGNF